jgi:RimJ/RimL family protein N-acetyltransferase
MQEHSHAGSESVCNVRCTFCGATLTFASDHAGTVQECTYCNEPVIVLADLKIAAPLPLPLKSRRLKLRRFEAADREALIALMRDEAALRYLDWAPLDEDEVREWVETEHVIRLGREEGWLCLGIEWREVENLIGFISLSFADVQRYQASFMLMINRDLRRQGFGAEAVQAVFAFGFGVIHLHRFIVGCDSRNVAARALLKSVGMRHEGTFVKDRCVGGEWVNTAWYALLAEEYDAHIKAS